MWYIPNLRMRLILSFVSRPHPITRKRDLVNFLELARTLVTV